MPAVGSRWQRTNPTTVTLATTMNVRARRIAALAFTTLLAGSNVCSQAQSKQANDEKSANRFLTFLELPDRRTQAVRGLLRLGSASVPALLRGAQHPDTDIATMSMQMLGQLGALAQPAEEGLRKLAASKTPEIAHAARWAMHRLHPTGEMLIADYTRGLLLTLAPHVAGKGDGEAAVLLKNLDSAWDCERLANGNFLVTHYTRHKVVEYTPQGKEVWSFQDLKSPLDADRLPNGNTLISDTGQSRVIEVNPDGKIVWQHTECKSPYDADRLPDGNTLISEYGERVAEFDAKGKVVWQHKIAGAFGADRLRNGNTLITDYTGSVLELDRQSNIMLRLHGVKQPNEARRLANGHTVVAESLRIRVFDATGKVVRTVALQTRPGTVQVY